MKIAIISPGELPMPALLGGAIETLMTHLINQNECEKNNLQFTIFNIDNKEIRRINNSYKFTEIRRISSKGIFSRIYNFLWRVIRRISFRKTYHRSSFSLGCIKEIKKENYEYVLIENYSQILQIKKQVKCKVILHLHSDSLNINTPLAKEITSACDKILVVSDFLKTRIVEIDSGNEPKTFVFKNAIDIKKFNKNLYLDFRGKFRDEISLKNNEMLIMYCGRLSKQKGVKELLLAFENISHLNCKLMIVGSSWFSNNEKTKYVIELEKIADRIKNKVMFTGYIPQDNLPQYYAAADIAVCPSICNEAAPLAIIEALASGMPVVTSDRGGIPEYASSESCEIVKFADYNDAYYIDNLSKSLKRLVVDREYYMQKQNHSRESVLVYNLESYYENFRKIILREV